MNEEDESFDLILESSSSEEKEENDEGPSYPRDLNPMPVRENYASDDMLEISKDDKELLFSVLTPCLFKNQAVLLSL